MSRDDLETKLSNARAELRALEAELPTFIKWRDGHQGRVDGARAGRAGPELLAEATGRLNTANELLSQHESDIRAAAEFVADCERDLERLDICERIRAADYELTYARQPWLEDALATCNSFIESATRLGEERRRLKKLHHEARMLRQRLIFGVPPERVAETLRELGVSEPEAVRDRAPQDWMLRRLTAATESVVSNRTITNFDDLSGLQHPGLDYLTVKPKLQPATVLREHRARR